MPTYEYMCSSCGKTFDVFQSIGAEPVRECKFCGKSVKRLISGGSGFIMKGGSSQMPCGSSGCDMPKNMPCGGNCGCGCH